MKTRIRSRRDFDEFFRRFFDSGEVRREYHPYFHQSVDRLWDSAEAFGLFSRSFGDLLEIGPGFAFLPFLWQASIAERVAILDGESFEIFEIEGVYRKHGIEPRFADLFRLFGERDPERNRLPFESDRFDAVVCWETMEHFNFNPIPFLEELRRVMRPGGVAFLTVPNQVRLDFRLRGLRGLSTRTPIGDYVRQLDDRNRMKYAPHWREYTLDEYAELLRHVGFELDHAAHLNTFTSPATLGPGRRLRRVLANAASRLVPSLSALCIAAARKA